MRFENSEKNIVLKKVLPGLKKISGKVFSLLTGGAGNNNYFHWLFDVLPRLKILENTIDLKKLIFFYFQNLVIGFKKKVWSY